jgi:8-oxo-dGTP pyrophosphatase MutT (NUDIX family)
MFKLVLRLLLHFFSRIFSTDKLADCFPVSIKCIVKDTQGRYLLLKNERDIWDFPGGKLLKGQKVIETVKKEVSEETCLKVEPKNLILFDNYLVNQVEVVIAIYDSTLLSDQPVQLSFEHSDYQFFSISEINSLNTPAWLNKALLLL